MRILHTADWHLGAQLHEQSRLPEQEEFLKWMLRTMDQEKPDALLIAGDVFDSCAPSNAALNLYYEFLSAVFRHCLCRRVVVVGGNHDSPSLLDAPGNVLDHIGTRVVGGVAYTKGNGDGRIPDHRNEVVVVEDSGGRPGLVIGAVPYLRDTDLRTSAAQESDEVRAEKRRIGFQQHYHAIADLARRECSTPGEPLPLVLTGHLFLAGGFTAAEKSERDLQVGNLTAFEPALLPPADYYAFGHLHSPQAIGGRETCRYSGSPLRMNFGEAHQEKSIVIVDLSPGLDPVVRRVPVPQTQRIEQLTGTPEAIASMLKELVASGVGAWVDVQVTEGEGDLTPWMHTEFPGLVEGTEVRLLRRQNARPGRAATTLAAAVADEAVLDSFSPGDLFRMRLSDEDLTREEKDAYASMLDEILREMDEAEGGKEQGR